MTDTFKPESEDDVVEAVSWAVAETRPLDLFSGATKRAIGRPPQAEYGLDLGALNGVTDYEPAELVITAKAATPIADIVALLDRNNQHLAFEPVDWGSLAGGSPGGGTLAGTYAANISGPRRISAGAARDHALGIRAVSGRGEVFKSGGRVMKNVTGYDLTKGLAGSWGTLAAFTELTFKVLPKPETVATLVVDGLSPDQAVDAMAAAMGSSADVSAAAHLPAGIVGDLQSDELAAGASATLLRLEGVKPSVEARARRLNELLMPFGRARRLGADPSITLWRRVGNAEPLARDPNRPLWRLSVRPTAGAAVFRRIREAIPQAHALFDWAGGLVWLELPADGPLGEDIVRSAVAESGGGHATLIRADAGRRAAIAVFQPQPAPLAALSERLKNQFDPHGVLNPGRMWAGI